MRNFLPVFILGMLFVWTPSVFCEDEDLTDPRPRTCVGRLQDGHHIKRKREDISDFSLRCGQRGNNASHCGDHISAGNKSMVKAFSKDLGKQVIIRGKEFTIFDAQDLFAENKNTVLDFYSVPEVPFFNLEEMRLVDFYRIDIPEKIEGDKPPLFKLWLKNPFDTFIELKVWVGGDMEYQPFETKVKLGPLQEKEMVFTLNRNFDSYVTRTDKSFALAIHGSAAPLALEANTSMAICFEEEFIYSGKTGLLKNAGQEKDVRKSR